MSAIKVILALVIAIPLLLIGALLFLLANPDYYREPIETTFEEETGLVLRIDGGIDWRYWPPVALRFTNADIRPEGSDTPLAEVREVDVDMDVWPLLTASPQISIRGISIDGLAINLVVDKAGKGNWEVETTPAASAGASQQPAPAEEETASSLGLDIRETRITDAKLHYTDARDGSDYTVTIASLSTGKMFYDEPAETRFQLALEDHAAAMRSSLEGDGHITFNRGFTHFALGALRTKQQLELPGMPPMQLDLTLNGEYDVDKAALRTDLSGQLDGDTLLGKLSLSLADRTDATFDLVFDRLDANRYLAPAPDEATGSQAQASTAPPEDEEVIPVDLLREIDFTGKLLIRSLLYDTHKLTDVSVDVDNRLGQLHANTQLHAYGGSLATSIELATGAEVAGTAEVELGALDVTKFAELDWITGAASMRSHTRFTGTRLRQILDSLTGDTTFTIDDGTLDVTPIKKLAETVDSLRGQQSAISRWPDRMPFEKLLGEHHLVNGIGTNQRFSMRLQPLNIAGRGGIDYFGNQLSYDLEATLDETNEGPFQVNADLARIKWPLHCEGALDASPTDLCLPDRKAVQKLLTDVAKQEIRDKGKEKILEKLPDGVKDAAEKLRDLFNR